MFLSFAHERLMSPLFANLTVIVALHRKPARGIVVPTAASDIDW